MRVLLVEDDPLLGTAVKVGLEQQGFVVDWVRDGVQAELAALDGNPAAVLLDLGLPRRDGMRVLTRLRRRDFQQPVLVITARDKIPDRILALDSGADDFIIKPFDVLELGARLRASLRRQMRQAQPDLVHGDIRVDMASRRVTQAGRPVRLTGLEYALLLHLMTHVGRLHTRSQLREALYSWDRHVESNALEVHIHHLRSKLGHELIRTVHGQGYILSGGQDGH
jgi:DNA-binding response OmpR family regulator